MGKMEQRYPLAKNGPQLWTREKARSIQGELGKLLGGLAPGGTLVIDAKGVEVFDFSFANELFGKTILALPHEFPGRFVVVENLSKYARENLTKALEGMGLAMIERKGKAIALIGKVHPTDERTFATIARAQHPVNAAELSRELKVNINAMNERLSKLSSLGIIRREIGSSPAGREQYVYSVLQ